VTDAMTGALRTAVWMADLRVGEPARPGSLFDDPLAEKFVAAAPPGAGDAQAAFPPGTSDFLAVRVRFFDDRARAAGAAGIRQVVLLAAGLDARAFRLDWPPGLRLYELDLPEVFAFKEPVLASAGAAPRCERVVIPVDLRADWPADLLAAGFDPAAATCWLAEGLLAYLDQAGVDRLAASATGLSAPGSRLAFDQLDGTATDRPAMRTVTETVEAVGARLASTMADPVGWLARYGWRATVSRVPALAESYGRPLPADLDLTASNAIGLVDATR